MGPCGGVTDSGMCEVPGVRCPFVEISEPRWPVNEQQRRPVDLGDFVVDLRPDVSQPSQLETVGRVFGEAGLTALVGDHIDEPDALEPPEIGRALRDTGVDAMITLTCRERNAAILGRYVSRLLALDVVAVHCVTGDHPAARFGATGDYDFPLDSFGLIALARSLGAMVSVAESPAAMPREIRPGRLAAKARAGASAAVLNHAGEPAVLVDFADRTHDLVPDLTLVAPVPVITDHHSAAALARFPGLVLPPGLTDRVLASSDPRAEGTAAAVEIGCALRASGRFAALNLSGPGADAPLPERARLMAEVAQAIRERCEGHDHGDR